MNATQFLFAPSPHIPSSIIDILNLTCEDALQENLRFSSPQLLTPSASPKPIQIPLHRCSSCNKTFPNEILMYNHSSFECPMNFMPQHQQQLKQAVCRGSGIGGNDAQRRQLNKGKYPYRGNTALTNGKVDTKFGTQLMRDPLPAPPTAVLPVATLYFGGIAKGDSLIGGSAWWLADTQSKMVATGSNSVIQTFPCLIRLEYEGLLNGLKAAFLKGVRRITVRGSSTIAITHYSKGEVSPYLNTVYYGIEDLHSAITKVLGQFEECNLELITIEKNYFAHKLADNVISQYYTKKLQRVEKQAAQSMKYPAVWNTYPFHTLNQPDIVDEQ